MELTWNIISFLQWEVAGRNAPAYTAAGLLEGLVVETSPVDFRFGQVTTQLQRWAICGAATKRPLVFAGTAHDGKEARTFHRRLKTLQRLIGV